MGRAAVIGEGVRIGGYGLAGALLFPVAGRDDAVRAWERLPADVAVVILTPSAAGWLAGELDGRPQVLPVVLPDVPADGAGAAGAAGAAWR